MTFTARSHGSRSQPPLNRVARRLQWLALLPLAAAAPLLEPGLLLSWLAVGMGLLAALKLLEARRIGELRTVGLLELLAAGLQAALLADLAATLLQVAAVLLALAGLLALEAGGRLPLGLLLRRSAAVLAAALPLALLMLVLLPRIGPLFPGAAGLQGGASTGLSDAVNPGAIASLAGNQAPAARVSFLASSHGRLAGPPPPAGRYWRVLVHEVFDGSGWQSRSGSLTRSWAQRPPADADAPAPTPAESLAASQLWLVDPSPVAAVPWDGASLPLQRGQLLTTAGELLDRRPAQGRRSYGLAPLPPGRQLLWQQRPPGRIDLQLPWGRNPRLEALGRQWGQLPQPEQRLAAAAQWFQAQPFRYTRDPGQLPEQAPLDAFLFERREGFCGHYASAFTALMRAAGVPARVVSGYYGGRWVQGLAGSPYLDIRQSDAHAWSEVWLAGRGWLRVDPSTWVEGGASGQGGAAAPGLLGPGPLQWLQRQWWGLDLAWSRLWLGFDGEQQRALLTRLLGERLEWAGLLALAAVAGALGLGLLLLAVLRERDQGDPLQRALQQEQRRWLRLCRRHGLEPGAGETLEALSRRLAQQLANPLGDPLRATLTSPQPTRAPAVGPQRDSQPAALALAYGELEAALRHGPPVSPEQQRLALRQLSQLRSALSGSLGRLGRTQGRSSALPSPTAVHDTSHGPQSDAPAPDLWRPRSQPPE